MNPFHSMICMTSNLLNCGGSSSGVFYHKSNQRTVFRIHKSWYLLYTTNVCCIVEIQLGWPEKLKT